MQIASIFYVIASTSVINFTHITIGGEIVIYFWIKVILRPDYYVPTVLNITGTADKFIVILILSSNYFSYILYSFRILIFVPFK